ncbi:MAG: helix-hairpin-helix domain-containing protein [Roseburia sp.]|nr:helix-hairpin-helix domain-containing protein [Roseburia sp.]
MKRKRDTHTRRGILGILFVCMMFGGCKEADKAVSISIGSSLEQTGESPGNTEDFGLSEADGRESLDGALQEGMVSDEEAFIYVHVCGAVVSPGVLKLPVGSRGADALARAGGFAEDASEDYINLAARLEDGQKLYFPTREEARVLQEEKQREDSGLVNINTADEAQLCTLTGIGESRARDIIAYREAHGAFARTEDIMLVSGIKESVYQKICGQITVE